MGTMNEHLTTGWGDAERSAQQMVRAHPFVIGGVQPCELSVTGRAGQPAVWCSVHQHGFNPYDYRKYILGHFPDICPVARLESWKAKRFILARSWGHDGRWPQ